MIPPIGSPPISVICINYVQDIFHDYKIRPGIDVPFAVTVLITLPYRNVSRMAIIVQLLIFGLLDYCSTVPIDPKLTNEQKVRLQKLQNACVRYIHVYGLNEGIVSFFTEAGWAGRVQPRGGKCIYSFFFYF